MPISIGVARGEIRINTNSGEVRAQMQRDMGAVNTTLQKTGKSAISAADGIKKLGSELTGLSIGAGAIATLGLRAAGSLEQLNVRYKALGATQSKFEEFTRRIGINLNKNNDAQKEGAALMKIVADRANELNLPVAKTQAAFAGLIPTIGKGRTEIDKYVGLATRLASLNPAEGIEGAIFSIREGITSGGQDLVSLGERFNLPKREFRELVNQTGDFATALDIILNKMGATEAAAKEVNAGFTGTWTRFIDTAQNALGKVFTPIIKELTPLLKQMADEIARFVENNPGIAEFAAKLTLAVAATGPLIAALGKVLSLGQAIGGLNISGGIKGAVDAVGGIGGAAKLGVLGLAGYTGIQLGTGLVGGLNIGGIRDRAEASGQTVSEVLGGDFKNVIGIVVTILGNLAEQLVVFVGSFVNAAMTAVSWLATLGERIQNAIQNKGFKSNAELDYEQKVAKEVQPTLDKYTPNPDANKYNIEDNAVRQQLKDLFGSEPINPFTGGSIKDELKADGKDPVFDLMTRQFELQKQLLAELNPPESQYVDKINKEFSTAIKNAGLQPFNGDQLDEALSWLRSYLEKQSNVADPNAPLFNADQFRSDWKQFIGDVLANTGLLDNNKGNASAAPSPSGVPRAKEELQASRQDQLDRASTQKGAEIGKTIQGIWNTIVTGAIDTFNKVMGAAPNADQVAAFGKYQEDKKQIEDKANEDELDARKDHNENLKKIDESADADIEAIHQRAKDQAAQDEQELQDRRAEIAANAKDRAAEAEQELQDKRAQIAAQTAEQIAAEEASYQADHTKIITDAQKTDLKLIDDYNKAKEKLERDHRLALAEAASNLDARAVAREQDQFGSKNKELDDKLKEERDANAKQAAERLAQLDQEHAAKLAQLQAAGAKELNEFIAQQQKKEQAQAASDQKSLEKLIAQQQLRAERQAAADAAEIAQINAKREQEKVLEGQDFTRRLNEIIAQKNRELQLREQKFKLEFDQLATHESQKLGIQRQYQAATELELRKWWERQRAMIAGTPAQAVTPPRSAQPGFGAGPGFATGTSRIPFDMAARVHQNEGIMSAPVAEMARSLLGNNYTQPQLGAFFAGKGQSIAPSFAWSGDLVVGDIGQRSDADVIGLVEEGISRAVSKLANKLQGQPS